MTRHQQGFRVIHPSGLPLTFGARSERAPSGFPLSFAPGRYQPRTSGQGRVWNTDPKSRLRHHAEPPIDETPSQRATSCRTVPICRRPGEAFTHPRRQFVHPVDRGCSRWDTGQAAGGVYTARVAGYQDELAEFRAAPEAVPDALRDSLLSVSGMPGMLNWAELARLPGVTPGRPSCLVRDGRKHPGSGHG